MKAWRPFLWLPLVALSAALSIVAIAPPPPLPASAPPTEFSAERAMVHLRRIASAPHPMGSPAADDTSSYIVEQFHALGINTDVVAGSAAVRVAGSVTSGRPHDIIARIPGTRGSGKAVALSAHFDSVPQSMGASDDGAGVVTLLETARALKARGPHPTDIVFIVTDGEEIAVLGATALAFGKTPDFASGTGVVLNFEARGSRGASAMYDRSEGDGELIRALGENASRPVASSFLSALAKALPNDGDVTVFKRVNVPALGFAYADGFENYHRHTDDVDHIDPASVQHHGDYALSISDALARREVDSLAAPDLAYFDVFARVLVRYPLWAARLFALATIAAFVAAVRREKARVRGVLAGAGVFLLTIALAAGVALLLQSLFGRYLDYYRLLSMVKVTAGATLLVAAAIVIGIYRLALGRLAAGSLTFGVLAAWALALAAAATFAPALTPPLQWPLAYALTGIWFAKRHWAVRPASLLPGVMLFAPVVYSVVVATGATMLFAPAIFAAFGFGLLAPLFAEKRTLVLAPAALAGGIACAVFAIQWSPYWHGEPVADSLVYGVDTDAKTACLFTYDGTSTKWLARSLTGATQQDTTPFTRWGWHYYGKTAPLEDHAPPAAEVTSDATEGATRHVSVHITVEKQARCVNIWDEEQTIVRATAIDGTPVRDLYRFSPERDEELLRWMNGDTSRHYFHMRHCRLNDGALDLALDAKPNLPIKLRIVAEEPGLPASIPPRERSIPSELSDVTLVSRLATF